MARPRVLVTRRWPEQVERVLSARFDTTLNESDRPFAETEFVSAIQDFDAVLPTVSDRLPLELFNRPGIRAKILGNFGVGFNHIDIAAARAAGDHCGAVDSVHSFGSVRGRQGRSVPEQYEHGGRRGVARVFTKAAKAASGNDFRCGFWQGITRFGSSSSSRNG